MPQLLIQLSFLHLKTFATKPISRKTNQLQERQINPFLQKSFKKIAKNSFLFTI